MDFAVTKIDNKMTIKVEVKKSGGGIVFSGTYTGVGGTQFWADEGTYSVAVTISAGNGNCTYGVKLVTPEVMYLIYNEDEVPLDMPIELFINDLGYDMKEMFDAGLPFTKDEMYESLVKSNYTYDKMIAFGFTADELKAYGTQSVGAMPQNQPLSGDVITYVVVKGDSLSLISKRQYGTIERWREIYEMNKGVIGSNPNYIKIGQTLTIKVK